VFEEVACVGRRAAAKHELGLDELAYRLGQFRFRQTSKRDNRRVVEAAADHRCRLRDFLHWLEPIKARHQ
jgi:hypothetical protein